MYDERIEELIFNNCVTHVWFVNSRVGKLDHILGLQTCLYLTFTALTPGLLSLQSLYDQKEF